MALPVEEATSELREAERSRLRRIIAELPRANPTSIFLAGTVSQLLDIQIRLEDALRAVTTLIVAPEQAGALAVVVGALRTTVLACSDLFGRLVVGARFDLALVNEALAFEEPIPGVSSALLWSLRASSRTDEAGTF